MNDPRDAVPERFRRFLPEQRSEPTPAERFDAWLAEQPDEAERWRVRSSPSHPRSRVGFVAALAVLASILVALGWRVLW